MLYLFNTTIMPNEGVFECKKISAETARKILDSETYATSAVGHQGSADALNIILEKDHIQVNRINAKMQRRDRAICLKVIGRIAEGQILDLSALNEIGYELYLVTMIADSADQMAVELNATIIYEHE